MSNNRRFLRCAIALSLLAISVTSAGALDYSKQTIKVVVPFAAAGVTDIVARVVFDRIAREGVVFSNTFCPVPSCSPTRSCMLTGRAAHQLGEAASLWSGFPKNLRVFTQALREKGLMIDRRLDFTLPGDKKYSIDGFQLIDTQKLTDLDGKTLIEWHRKGWLAACYAHLQSLARVDELLLALAVVDPVVGQGQARDEPRVEPVLVARLEDARAEAAADRVVLDRHDRDASAQEVLQERHVDGLREARVVEVDRVLAELLLLELARKVQLAPDHLLDCRGALVADLARDVELLGARLLGQHKAVI